MSDVNDLGNGFKVAIQKTQDDHWRAVVKNIDGEIVTRGPVVTEREIGRSRFLAVNEWMTANLPTKPESAPGVGELYGEENEEDEEYL